MNATRAPRRLALIAALLGAGALAHGESPVVNLRGARPCLDSTSVRLSLSGTPAARRGPIRKVGLGLGGLVSAALRAGGVPHETRASCRDSAAYTLVMLDVRYLDPRQYVGFGNPAYSYLLSLQVGPGAGRPVPAAARTTAIQFSSVWSDIHSESRTGQPVARMLSALGRTQAQDLVRAWRGDNPGRQGGS